MNSLNVEDKLINLLQSDEQIQRFKELESMIDHNSEIQEKYKQLLNLQKIMVQHEAKQHKDLEHSTQKYETAKQELLQYFVVEEYLDLLTNINNDLNMIQRIIEQEIAKDFD